MAFEIQLHPGYVHIDWYGTLCNEDLLDIGRRLPEVAKKIGCAPHVLHTFDRIAQSTLKPWDAFQHSIRREDTRLGNRAKSAAVAKTPTVRAMATLFQQLNRNPNIEMEIFENEPAALDWLLNETDPTTASRSPERGTLAEAQ